MELEFTASTLPYLKQVLWEERCREESTDAIIPDTSPDVERILSVSGEAVMRSKECRQGSVCVSGGIRCAVLYLAEQEQQPRQLELYIPYSIRADGTGLTEDAHVVFCPWIRNADARVVNSRKLTVRAELCYSLRVYETHKDTCPVLSSCPETLQTQESVYSLLLPVEIGERSFRMTEELQLPQSKPLTGQILHYETRLELSEKRLAGNKAVFKGVVHVSMLYESEENRQYTHLTELPFSQFCELREVYDEEEPEMILAVTGSEVERTARQEGEGILLTVHILAQSIVYARRELSVCSDAYALNGTLTPQWCTLDIQSCLDRQNFTRTLRESWQGSVSEVVDARCYLDEPFVQRSEGAAELVVNGCVKVLYRDPSGLLQECSIRLGLREPLNASPGVVFRLCAAIVGEPTVLASSGGMELRCTVHVQACSETEGHYRTLSGGTLQDAPQVSRPAVIVRRAQAGERLWDIAKNSGTTVERIRRANGLDGEETECGILLIPT